MFGLGLPEIIIILAAIGVLLFGGKKIVELARSVGRVSGEYKKGKMEVEKELKEAAKDIEGKDIGGKEDLSQEKK